MSRLANRVRSKLLGDGSSDTGCSLKVMSGRLVDTLPFFRGAHRFMPALAQIEGYTVVEHPVSHRPRNAGNTKYSDFDRLKATLPDLFAVIWLKSRYCRFRAWEIRR